MNTLITAIVPYIVPLVAIIVGWLTHHFAVYVPAQQRAYITTWAQKAVAKVAQLGTGKSDQEKKQMAMDDIDGFFRAFNLPVPPDDILSSFIEAAVNELNKAVPVAVVATTATDPTPQIGSPQIKRAGL